MITAHDQFRSILRDFSETTRTIYGDYAFAAGYLEALAGQLLTEMPKPKQQQFITEMMRALDAHRRQVDSAEGQR